MEAQKYPEDFDAIIAGAPANFQTHLHAWDLSVAVPALKDPAAAVPAAKLAMLNKAAIDACDAKDGLKDGLINNPRACAFDPSVLLCKGRQQRLGQLPDRAAARVREARLRDHEDEERRGRVSRQGTRQRNGLGRRARRPAGARRLGRLVSGGLQRRELGREDVRPRSRSEAGRREGREHRQRGQPGSVARSRRAAARS